MSGVDGSIGRSVSGDTSRLRHVTERLTDG
jgi:hypothetical protein